MFGEIMRHAYDMKMGVLVEKIRERQAERRVGLVIGNVVAVVANRSGIRLAWNRIRATYINSIRTQKSLLARWSSTLSSLNRLAKKRNLKLSLGYLHLWHSNTRLLAFDSTSQIHNLVKTIFLSVIGVI